MEIKKDDEEQEKKHESEKQRIVYSEIRKKEQVGKFKKRLKQQNVMILGFKKTN